MECLGLRHDEKLQGNDALTADDLPVCVYAPSRCAQSPVNLLSGSEVGPEGQATVHPQLLSAVRGRRQLLMVTLPEQAAKSAIRSKRRRRNTEGSPFGCLQRGAFRNGIFPDGLEGHQQKQAKEQEKEQKDFEVVIAQHNAEIARIQAKGEVIH